MATQQGHSFADVCEAVWDAERALGLLDLQLRGVHVWQGLRFEQFLKLMAGTGAIGAEISPELVPTGLKAQLRLAASLGRGSMTHNPFVFRGPVDAMVFEHARSVSVDGVRVCAYSAPLVQELTERGKRVMLLDQAYAGVHSKAPDPRRRYRDLMELGSALRIRARPEKLSAAELAPVLEAERFFEQRLGVRLSLAARLRTYLPSFQIEHAMYRALFRLHRPKRIYCVVAYGRLAPMLLAAHELGVESIELQHGTITRFNMGYSYPVLPQRGRLAYLPDTLYGWGPPWNELARTTLRPDVWDVVDYGFAHFERRKGRYAGVAKVPGRVLVISQTVHTDRLASEILAALPALADRDIVYKLHPGEYASWRQHPTLVRLAQAPNVRVVTDTDLYQQMAEAELQIGVFSTALYEGLAFGCSTVLVPLPGHEYVADLVAQGRAETWQTFLARCGTSPA